MALFCILILSSQANALDLYTYTDKYGQQIVVGNPQAIPPAYRQSITKNTIRTFSEPVLKKPSSEPGLKHQGKIVTKHEDEPEKTSIELIPAIEEPNYKASATAWISILNEVQKNNESLYAISMSQGSNNPLIKLLNSKNLQLLEQTNEFSSFKWKSHANWVKSADLLTNDLKTSQYTITNWILNDENAIKNALPILLKGLRIKLDMLNNSMPKGNE